MLKEGNKFLCAIIAGLIGAIARDLYSILGKSIGIAHFYFWNIAADLFVDGKEIFSFWGYVIRVLTDWTICSLLGVIFAIIIEVLGPKYYLLKGIGIAWLTMVILMVFLLHIFKHAFTIVPDKAFILFSAYIAHTLFGAFMSYTYIKLAKIKVSGW